MDTVKGSKEPQKNTEINLKITSKNQNQTFYVFLL